ncbi:hypothetical protein C0431_08945 [bacterium]|nr:hypothetical protein [bacterium]
MGMLAVPTLNLPELFSSQITSRLRVKRIETDRFDVVLGGQEKFRILQLTDTHFGTAAPDARIKDRMSETLIRGLVEEHRPDFIFHTGDFINNDRENPEFGALDFMNSLGVPWSVVLGNHDHPNGKAGQRSLEQYYEGLKEATVGFADKGAGARDYCFRIDLRREDSKPFASLLAFNTGDPQSGMKVNATQTEWFRRQLVADQAKGIDCPFLVMQHIPTIEYHEVYEQKLAIGRRGEAVCFEIDKGEIFSQYVESKRVRAVFCGHDHVNDYTGIYRDVALVYGRCSGFNGYGDWHRGGRLIDIDVRTGRGETRVVLADQAVEKSEWSRTLEKWKFESVG